MRCDGRAYWDVAGLRGCHRPQASGALGREFVLANPRASLRCCRIAAWPRQRTTMPNLAAARNAPRGTYIPRIHTPIQVWFDSGKVAVANCKDFFSWVRSLAAK